MFTQLEPSRDKDQFIFRGNIGTASDIIPFTIPPSARGVRFTLIGGGSGGAHAVLGTGGTLRSSGAGGNSGAVTTVTFLAFILPTTVYLKCGWGGLASTTSGVQGGVGGPSIVSTDPAGLYVLGYAGGGTAAGTAAVVAATAVNMPFATAALSINAVAGILGGASTSATGTSITPVAASIVSAGASGGGVSAANAISAGGGVLANANFPSYFAAVAGPSTDGQQGSSGYWSWRPMFGIGGCGGAGSTGVCGIGGDGAYGCGGGGSGAGNIASSSGNGGPGLIIVNCW